MVSRAVAVGARGAEHCVVYSCPVTIDRTPNRSEPDRGNARLEARWLGGISAASGLIGALIGGLFSYLVAHQQSSSQAQASAQDYLRSQRQTIYISYMADMTNIISLEYKIHGEASSNPMQANVDLAAAQTKRNALNLEYAKLVLIASPGVLGAANAFDDAQRPLFQAAPGEATARSPLSQFEQTFESAIREAGDAAANLLTFARRDIYTLSEPVPTYTRTQYNVATATASASSLGTSPTK